MENNVVSLVMKRWDSHSLFCLSPPLQGANPGHKGSIRHSGHRLLSQLPWSISLGRRIVHPDWSTRASPGQPPGLAPWPGSHKPVKPWVTVAWPQLWHSVQECGSALGQYRWTSQPEVYSNSGETNAAIRYNHIFFCCFSPKVLEGFPTIDKIIFTKLKCNICSGAC